VVTRPGVDLQTPGVAGSLLGMPEWDPAAARDTELWSTIDITVDRVSTQSLEWFSYSRSMQVAGSTRMATAADTNVLLPGRMPQGDRFEVRAWRARATASRSLMRTDAWWAWCATVAIRFDYNDRTVTMWTLDELLRAPRPRHDYASPGTFNPAIVLLEHLNYCVRFEPQNPPTPAFQAALLDSVADDPMNAVVAAKDWAPIKIRCYLRGLRWQGVC